MLNKFEGIVLKARDYGESHQILTVFTEFQGKMALMARGSKKTKSRFSAVTEPFTVAHFVSFAGGGIASLSQADLLDSHHRIRSDLLLTSYGAYWFELLDKCLEEKEPNPAFYRLLKAALTRLEEGTDPEILTRVIELRALTLAGSTPVLEHCAHCRAQARPARFSVTQGGFLCDACAHLDVKAYPVSQASGRILPLLQRLSLDRMGEVMVKAETNQQLETLIHAFMKEYLPFECKSYALLDSIRKTWANK
ncbi:DNA repair protein RecO [Laceyella putida]|uniref:DNA repair protein RecO n=1 Tax=Laceyella putida TaxID=110101 RepID=A0ABW2RHY0_9BACL